MIIEDGKGSGNEVQIDECNRMHVHSFTVNMDTSSALSCDAFDVGSNVLTLTSANQSAIMYIKNNEDDDLIVSKVFVNIDTSTGGSGEALVKFHFNPTGGTIISSATDSIKINRKMGSSSTLDVNSYKGAEASTITGGTDVEFLTLGAASSTPFIIPKGGTFGLSITPPVGNTSVRVAIGMYIIKNATKYGND